LFALKGLEIGGPFNSNLCRISKPVLALFLPSVSPLDSTTKRVLFFRGTCNGVFHFMHGFLSSATLGFHCTKNNVASNKQFLSIVPYLF